jgi:hypothetical protein
MYVRRFATDHREARKEKTVEMLRTISILITNISFEPASGLVQMEIFTTVFYAFRVSD